MDVLLYKKCIIQGNLELAYMTWVSFFEALPVYVFIYVHTSLLLLDRHSLSVFYFLSKALLLPTD